MKRTLLAVAIGCLAACSVDGTIGTVGTDSDEWADDEYVALEPEGLAPVVEVGEVVDDPDPVSETDPCLHGGDCADEEPDDGTDAPNPYEPGDVLLVIKYAPFRKEPNNKAGVKAVHTNGGVHGGHPKGVVPPGQEVVVLAEPRTNGFHKVEYRGYRGWIHRNKLEPVDASIHPVKFARKAAVRNAFFMHQIKRTRWNKDGPLSSANCAPTSLAMAAKIFGLDKQGRTIERSIHAARGTYDSPPLCETCGTDRDEIRQGAKKLGFQVKTLGPSGSWNDRMDRLDRQLNWKRVVVLEGEPKGSLGAAYRNRMTAAYQADGVNRSYTYQGKHSILVVSRLDNGKYLVADPLSEVGMVTMTRMQLKSFFKSWGGTGNALH